MNPRGAPLRAWVTDIGGSAPQVSPAALAMLGTVDGVEIRALHSGALGG